MLWAAFYYHVDAKAIFFNFEQKRMAFKRDFIDVIWRYKTVNFARKIWNLK